MTDEVHSWGVGIFAGGKLAWADVDEIVIQGGARTTGKSVGKIPKPIRFPKD